MIRPDQRDPYVAFAGDDCIATGSLAEVALAAHRAGNPSSGTAIVVLDAATSQVVDLDLRGSADDVRVRYDQPGPAGSAADTDVDARPRRSGPGRPHLGVVSREVSLLPRHWAWLGTQRGGASAALRRLVEEARHRNVTTDQLEAAQESVDRFMRVMAGDRANYEEALRAFYAGRDEDVARLTAAWPPDVRSHLASLVRHCRVPGP